MRLVLPKHLHRINTVTRTHFYDPTSISTLLQSAYPISQLTVLRKLILTFEPGRSRTMTEHTNEYKLWIQLALNELLKQKKIDLRIYLFFDLDKARFHDDTWMPTNRMRLMFGDWPLREFIDVPRTVEERAKSEQGGLSWERLDVGVEV